MCSSTMLPSIVIDCKDTTCLCDKRPRGYACTQGTQTWNRRILTTTAVRKVIGNEHRTEFSTVALLLARDLSTVVHVVPCHLGTCYMCLSV